MSEIEMVQVEPAETHDLRRRVLRNGTPSRDLNYAQDVVDGEFTDAATGLPHHLIVMDRPVNR